MREILFYETSSGQKPIEDFLDQLSSKQAQKVTWVLKLIEELDRIPSKYFKKMVNTHELWEVRASLGSNVFRLLGFFSARITLFWPMHSRRRLKIQQRRPLKSPRNEEKTIFGGNKNERSSKIYKKQEVLRS